MNGSETPRVTGRRARSSGAAAASLSPEAASELSSLAVVDGRREPAERRRRLPRVLRDQLVVERPRLDRVPAARLLGRRQGVVEDVQNPLVLPHAQRGAGDERDQADDDAGAELREVLDEAQPVFVPD